MTAIIFMKTAMVLWDVCVFPKTRYKDWGVAMDIIEPVVLREETKMEEEEARTLDIWGRYLNSDLCDISTLQRLSELQI